jgi:NADPH:quinone reductase-like Zn-dependent oxidoreductase
LVREELNLPGPADHEAVVEPQVGSWEANMSHALLRSPVDVCRQRGDNAVVLGNSGVVRVLSPAKAAPCPPRGTLCMVMPFGKRDRQGYIERVYAYDAPGTHGLLARRIPVPAELLLPLPPDSAHPPESWAPNLRYFTAWDNWQVAYGCWRSQTRGEDPQDHLVFGWGGGVVLAELTLAQRQGFRTAMAVGSDERAAALQRRGITPVDRRDYPDLAYDTDPLTAEAGARQMRAERRFLKTVAELSDGRGVSIFLDNIGGPLYQLTARALGRQSVIATCGWKAGMHLSVVRATECQKRRLHVNTHGWRFGDSPVIRDLQEATGWIAEVDADSVYDFDDVPRLAADFAAGRLSGYFPLYRVNKT